MVYSPPMPDIERELRCAALALLHEQGQRMKAMESQLAAKVQENRDLRADLLRLLRKGPR